MHTLFSCQESFCCCSTSRSAWTAMCGASTAQPEQVVRCQVSITKFWQRIHAQLLTSCLGVCFMLQEDRYAQCEQYVCLSVYLLVCVAVAVPAYRIFCTCISLSRPPASTPFAEMSCGYTCYSMSHCVWGRTECSLGCLLCTMVK